MTTKKTSRARILWRTALASLGVIFLLSGLLGAANAVAYQVRGYRLEPLYGMARDLKKGMPRDEALELIARHWQPYLTRHDFPNGDITVWVDYSLLDICSTSIAFADGTVALTTTMGEDHPLDRCPGAPPNVR
jgi:hypothetical protein